MSSIGDTLRRERLRLGWTLKQVADETKIRPHLLEALEEDRLDGLPSALLTRSFARQYARALGLDKEALVSVERQTEELAAQIPEPKLWRNSAHIPLLQPLKFQRRLNRSSLLAFVWLLLAVFACSKVYTMWRHGRETPANAVAEVSERARSADLAPAAPARLASTPKPELKAAAEPTVPTGAGASGTAPGAAAGIHVALTATEPVWISTKSDGKPVYSGTLQTQETRYFDGINEMMVIIGNAGGLQATLNGKPVGPIGAHGEIRLLELTPAGARIAPRAKPTAPFALDGSVVRNAEDER
jgi:cytoskeletal protein RodZ